MAFSSGFDSHMHPFMLQTDRSVFMFFTIQLLRPAAMFHYAKFSIFQVAWENTAWPTLAPQNGNDAPRVNLLFGKEQVTCQSDQFIINQSLRTLVITSDYDPSAMSLMISGIWE